MKNCTIWKILTEELKKVFSQKSFWLAIVAVFGICFVVPIYGKEDGSSLNTAQIIFNLSKEMQLEDTYNSFFYVMQEAKSGYFLMFGILLSGITVVPMLCEERECGVFRFILLRTGKKKLAVGKLLSAMLCGGIALMAGYILFAVTVYGFLPHGSDYPGMCMIENYITWTGEWFGKMDIRLQYLLLLCQICFGVFCFGMVSAFWTYVMSIITKNTYLATCIPFMLLNFFSNTLDVRAAEGRMGNPIIHLVQRYFLPIRVLSMGSDISETGILLALYGFLCIIAVVLYIVRLEVRVDCGK